MGRRIHHLRPSGRHHAARFVIGVLASSTIFLSPATASAGGPTTEGPAAGQAAPHQTTCTYSAGAAVNSFCSYLRDRALQVAEIAINTDWGNCPNNQLNGATYSDDGTLNSQLDWYEVSSGYYCYFFIGEGDNNDFDFDDSWFVGIRVWV
ncbi:MAG: hypothetical protein JO121_09440, partial [Deltaproteobacteria bacterium]|nr:hypothetical protein [Deltaproteobacteria bacterium]